MKIRSIPRVPPVNDPERRGFDEVVKERLEVIAGQRGVRIVPLDVSTATAAQCAAKLNEILTVLQG